MLFIFPFQTLNELFLKILQIYNLFDKTDLIQLHQDN